MSRKKQYWRSKKSAVEMDAFIWIEEEESPIEVVAGNTYNGTIVSISPTAYYLRPKGVPMDVRNFSILYDLLCDSVDLAGDSGRQTALVKTQALDGRRLPVIAMERISPGGSIAIRLYYPISRDDYMRGLSRESIARINIANLYSGRNRAISAGLGIIEDQYFLYISYDTLWKGQSLDALYPELYSYVNQFACWVGIQYEAK